MAFPLAENITDPTAMIVYGNAVTENLIGAFILIAIYGGILLYLLFKQDVRTIDAFTTAILITTICTLLFRVMKVIQDRHLIIVLAILVLTVGYLFMAGGAGDTT